MSEQADPTFADFIATHKNGVTNADITDLWRELNDAVGRIGKSGALTITLKVNKQGDMIGVVDDIKVKLPNVAEERLYWVDANGNLTQRHPLQPSLPDPSFDTSTDH
jgi:hypothetical protein